MGVQVTTEDLSADMISHCNKWGGVLMYDKNKGGIYFCSSDDKTYYERWCIYCKQFSLFEWRLSGLKGLELEIIYSSSID